MRVGSSLLFKLGMSNPRIVTPPRDGRTSFDVFGSEYANTGDLGLADLQLVIGLARCAIGQLDLERTSAVALFGRT